MQSENVVAVEDLWLADAADAGVAALRLHWSQFGACELDHNKWQELAVNLTSPSMLTHGALAPDAFKFKLALTDNLPVLI